MSFTTLTYFLLLFIITITEGGKKNTKEKIIIHVPYKIHKHHHTHTKYKVITIPAPKKENTVIYLKEEIQPIIQHVPELKAHTEVKSSEQFVPPHQESAAKLLEDMTKHKVESLPQTDQQHQYSTIVDDQKPLETHMGQSTEGFIPSFTYKPIILPPHENFIPNFSFKPILYPQHAFTSKFIMDQHFLPKFMYQPLVNQNFRPKYPSTHPKDLQDNVAHSSDPVYKTITSRPNKVKAYKVKEEVLEDHKHQHLNRIPVPSTKFNRKGKSFMRPAFNNQLKNPFLPADPDYEYEHVGYLIIDGNTRKMVGKNFKDEIHLTR